MSAISFDHLILCGSPRRRGRSAALAHQLERDHAHARVLFVSELCVAGCKGCDACKVTTTQICCVQEDDMQQVYDALSSAKRLFVVCPLYFAGPPSQFKALLDRFQPYYWANARALPKRPACLYVLGEGGDPHGADPLITIVRSALAVAGFSLERIEVRTDGNR